MTEDNESETVSETNIETNIAIAVNTMGCALIAALLFVLVDVALILFCLSKGFHAG